MQDIFYHSDVETIIGIAGLAGTMESNKDFEVQDEGDFAKIVFRAYKYYLDHANDEVFLDSWKVIEDGIWKAIAEYNGGIL